MARFFSRLSLSIPALLTLLLAGSVLLSPAWAGKDTPFSADHVTISPQGQEMTGKLFFTPDKMRMEQNPPGGPGQIVFVYLKKEKKMIMWSPTKKKYFESVLDASQWPGIDEELKPIEKKKLGTEKVSGYNCTNYKVVREIDIMGRKRKIELLTWETDKLAFPIRTKTNEGMVQELRNIKEGQPPAGVFQVPKGYEKVGNMMEMMMPSQ